MPRKILLACTGSVASIKVPEIVEELSKLPEVSIVLWILCYYFVGGDLRCHYR